MKKGKSIILSAIAAVIVIIGGWLAPESDTSMTNPNINSVDELSEGGISREELSLQNIPEYTNEPYVVINDNTPFFTEEDYMETSFETYSELDELGRCGVAYANVGVDIMPTEKRGEIGHVKPTGWKSVKYDIVEGKSLYNRCHLLGFQLTGENANKENLITGTRYFNVDGMLPFENMIADYVKETENHVLYRVTPMYEGENLVAHGALMEAWSVEDDGEGVCFNVFAYNVQPGIVIDYATGESALAEQKTQVQGGTENNTYILNTSGKKFHRPNCSSVTNMAPENRKEYTGKKSDLMVQGYEACGRCNP